MTSKSDLPLPDKRIPVVVFDLDGTLAESMWPHRREVGPPILEGVTMLRWYATQGYRCEIYTARPGVDQGIIWSWVLQHGLPVDVVTCGKPFGGLYIDDRAYCPDYTKTLPPVPLPLDEEEADGSGIDDWGEDEEPIIIGKDAA
jgi:hypothetical protein